MFRLKIFDAPVAGARLLSQVGRPSVSRFQPRGRLLLTSKSLPERATLLIRTQHQHHRPFSSRTPPSLSHLLRQRRSPLLPQFQPTTFFRTKPSHQSPLLPSSSSPRRSLHNSPHPSARYSYSNRYDPHRASTAQPLLTPQQLSSISRSPSFRAILLLSSGAALLFYYTHIEEVPVSGRKRFNCFSEASAEAQGDLAYRQILAEEGAQGSILPPYDRRVRMVERVLSRLIEAGDLGTGHAPNTRGTGWEVHVIEAPDTANAFVLPGGKVFVYSGILPICRNDDGLAAVLGHEIAHNLAHHSAERMSSMVILQPIVWLFQYLDATGITLGFGGFLSRLMLDLGVMRPASREQESEADYIGLLLMAQGCYDPNAAVGLWERMERENKGGKGVPEWLSTHPSNTSRVEKIRGWLPKAEERREESQCAGIGGYAEGFREAVGLGGRWAF